MQNPKIVPVIIVAVIVIVVAVVGWYFTQAPAAPPGEGELPGEIVPLDQLPVYVWDPEKVYTPQKGFEPTHYSVVLDALTEEDIEEVRTMGLKVALEFQTPASDIPFLQEAGIRDACEEFGIEVIGRTYSDWDATKEIEDIETFIALEPDYITGVSCDPEAAKTAWKTAADAGIGVLPMDFFIPGLSYPEDFVCMSTCDPRGMGVAAAHALAVALNYEGQVITYDWAIEFFVTAERINGFRGAMKNYPDIQLVGYEEFSDPTKAGEIAEAFLPKYPDLDGIFISWTEPPGMLTIEAAAVLGRTDLKVSSCDMSEKAALQMVEGRLPEIVGIGAQQAYLQGYINIVLLALDAVGKETPPYVVVNPLEVTLANLRDSWEIIYRDAAPLPDFLK